MTVFVDADSCPVRVREIICKAASRVKRSAVFAANRSIPLAIKSNFIKMIITDSAEQCRARRSYRYARYSACKAACR